MLGDMFLWLVANLKQGVIYFIKQALPPNKSAGSVATRHACLEAREAGFLALQNPKTVSLGIG